MPIGCDKFVASRVASQLPFATMALAMVTFSPAPGETHPSRTRRHRTRRSMLELLAEAIQRTNYALVPRPRQFQQLPMQAGLGSDVASANNEGTSRQRHALAPVLNALRDPPGEGE